MGRFGGSAFGQLIDRLMETKYYYLWTPEEERVVFGFRDEAARGERRGYVIGGAVAWGLTRRLKLPRGKLNFLARFTMRICATLAGGRALSIWNQHRAIKRSEERVALLEGSPLQSELIAILAEHHPNSALWKRYLKHHAPVLVNDDVEGDWYLILSGLPMVSIAAQADSTFKEPQPAVNEQPSDQSTLAKFYELSLWNEAEDSGDAGPGQERAVKEKRRSRMTAAERRSYNREQFLSRERQQRKHQEAFSG